ncbi:MAG: hypothetical protein IJN19_03585 [Opitutales bacterium]|nr:hypothetical protein [Opitutales bacterium]
MILKTAQDFFEKVFAVRGKIIALPQSRLPARVWRNVGAFPVSDVDISPRKTVFENISAPLAAAGTPWEIARERIANELEFWFGETNGETAPQTLTEETDSRCVALAAACAAKPEGAALVVSTEMLGACSLFDELRERAVRGNFAVIVECASYLTARKADLLAFFPKVNSDGEPDLSESIVCTPADAEAAPEALCVARKLRLAKFGETILSENTFSGTLLGAGAGEFFAELSTGTQIRGKLCGNTTESVPEGADIEIFLPPEIFHIDTFPPEENFFELEKSDDSNAGEIFYDGHLFYRQFRTADKYFAVTVAAQHRQSLEIPDGGRLYAWFFPEDAAGFVSKLNASGIEPQANQ